MTGEAAAEPLVRWDPTRQVLVGADGDFTPTEAQRVKAQAYLRGNRIHAGPEVSDEVGWGLPSKSIQTYTLDPIPGTRQTRTVKVATFYDAAGVLTGITMRCDCQKAAGTVALRADACSHVLAVHLYRLNPPKEN